MAGSRPAICFCGFEFQTANLVIARSEATRQIQFSFFKVKLDCFASLAMTLFELSLRQETDHGLGEGVRLLDI